MPALAPQKVRIGPAGLEIATFRRRVAGFLIDQVILAVLSLPIFVVTIGRADPTSTSQTDAAFRLFSFGYLILATGYYWYFNIRGRTPGKRAVGLRLVNRDGEPPSIFRSLVRAAAIQISSILWLGYLWAAWDPQTRTWHDRWAHTWVVRDPAPGEAPHADGNDTPPPQP